MKKLSEMTLDELWALFPIILSPHSAEWKDFFHAEKAQISSILSAFSPRISHIGSTAVTGIYAKPTVDILAELKTANDLSCAAELLTQSGWLIMSKSADRISLNKGYTEQGFAERVFHLHLRLLGDNDELYFRDYLLKYPQIAKEYETLKLSLWKQFERNRDGYTQAKTQFVQKYTSLAKQEFSDRYKR